MDKAHLQLKVKKIGSDDEKYVEGLVYEPDTIDTWGEMMLKEDVKTMAHRYMRDVVLKGSIDTLHDNQSNGSYPVASYIAKTNDPDGYPEGGWVLGVQITDDAIWEKVKKGEINGFSFEAWVTKTPAVVTIEYTPQIVGETEENEGHTHFYVLDLNEKGGVVGGVTSTVNGHFHVIKAGTATSEAAGHAHRIFLSQ